MLKEQLFAASAPILTPLTLSNGVEVFVRSLSGQELGKVHHLTEQAKAKGTDATHVNVMAIIWAVVDAAGKAIFDHDDSDKVASLPWAIFNELIQAVLKASGMQVDSLDEAKNA